MNDELSQGSFSSRSVSLHDSLFGDGEEAVEQETAEKTTDPKVVKPKEDALVRTEKFLTYKKIVNQMYGIDKKQKQILMKKKKFADNENEFDLDPQVFKILKDAKEREEDQKNCSGSDEE